jgi:hypothetical protein
MYGAPYTSIYSAPVPCKLSQTVTLPTYVQEVLGSNHRHDTN